MGDAMCVVFSWRAGRGEEEGGYERICLRACMGYPWERDIIRTGVVCCCFPEVRVRRGGGALRLFDCQPEPVWPVLNPQDHVSPQGGGWGWGRWCFWDWNMMNKECRVSHRTDTTQHEFPPLVCYCTVILLNDLMGLLFIFCRLFTYNYRRHTGVMFSLYFFFTVWMLINHPW